MEDLDLFFEYEKNDSICEFRINYNRFKKIRKISIEDLLYLQRLYKSFQKELILEINKLEDHFQIEQLAEQISKINQIYDYLQKELNKKKSVKKQKKNGDSEKNINFKDNKKVLIKENITSKKQEMINLFEENLLINYSLEDILFSLADYLKSEEINDQLLNITKEITRVLEQKLNKGEEIVDGIYLAKDAVKYRMSHESKDNIEQRDKLKQIRNLLDFIIKSYKEEKDEIKHDYLFDIVDFFLSDEKYYLYIQKLLEEIPRTVNIRYLNESKEQEHIVFYILDKFIDNYDKMITDKNSDYINKDYLKSVYLLFTQNYSISLNEQEKKKIDQKLYLFMRKVNNKLTSSKRQNAVKEDLKIMYSDKFFMHRKLFVQKDVDIFKLEWQMNSLLYNFNRSLNEQKRKDLTKEELIIFNNGFHAYSLEQLDEKTLLKIHVIDLYNIIIDYTELDKEIFNQTLKNEKIDPFITDIIEMKEMKLVPTITYEIPIDKNGDYIKEDIKFYPSKIKIKKLSNKTNDDNLIKLLKIYNGELNENITLSDIDKYFENILNDCIISYFETNNLPFIYSGKKQKDQMEFVQIMNQIGHILTKLEKDEFNKIYNIVNSDIDRFHYTIMPFDGEYQLSIINPTDYIGIINQRLLYEVVMYNKNNPDEYVRVIKDYQKKYDELVAVLNYYRDYVDSDVLKADAGKIKKIRKILF